MLQGEVERLRAEVERRRRMARELPRDLFLVPMERLPSLIDHTALKPETTPAQIARLCQEALAYRFASVCVNPGYVPLAARLLAEDAGGPVEAGGPGRAAPGPVVCTVVGFPLGATSTAAKVAETRQAVRDGASEIDMVLPIGRLIAGDWRAVYEDIRAVADETPARGCLKVIIEACLLDEEQKVAACVLAAAAGAPYVKTSTGFSTGGATVADVHLMMAAHGTVKAAGGIRTWAHAEAMLRAGASRLGCSASVAIVEGRP